MVATSADAFGVNDHVPIRRIGAADVRAALSEGFADFRDKRGDLVFLALIYPLVSLLAAFAALGGSLMTLFFPLAAGLSLLGPLVASGFYVLAKRREQGMEAGWTHFFDMRKSPSFPAFLAVAALMVAIFVAWVWAASAIHEFYLGDAQPATLAAFLDQLFHTSAGWQMMIVGDLVGLVFAVLILALTLVSLPMLVDRNVDAGTALVTSLRAVRANPACALRWGLTVAVLLVLGSIPAFIGLAVVLPTLGYATWHLYTRIVDRGVLPEAET